MLLFVLAALLLTTGVVFVLVPVHMVMTGAVMLMLGAAVLICALLHRTADRKLCFLRELLAAAASVSLILLMTCMGLITAGDRGSASGKEQPSEYAIVLGASVCEDGTASRIMRARVQAALEFMESSPAAVVILSGGQGGDEPITEAACMYETMIAMGADPERLLLEDQSHTTWENLCNCRALIKGMGGTDAPVTLITSEFHIRRALFLAEKLGMDVCGLPAGTDLWFFRVNYTLREVFAMVKAMLQTAPAL